MAALLAAMMLATVGCAAANAYEDGMRLLGQRRYDLAVTKLTEAVRRDPDEQKYRLALGEARSRGAAWHVDQGRSRLAEAQLAAALDEAALALELRPGLEAALALRQDALAQRARAQARRDQAMSLSDAGQHERALTEMRQALRIDRSLPGGPSEMDRLLERACAWRLARARAELAAGRWDAAESEARYALEHRPDSEAAQSVLNTARDRRRAQELTAAGAEHERLGRLREALSAYSQAQRLHPGQHGLATRLGRVKAGVCDELLSQAAMLLAEGEPVAALRALAESRALLSGYGGVDAQIARAHYALAERHAQAARGAASAERPATEALHWMLAARYGVGEADRERSRQALTRLAGKLPTTIALLSVDRGPRPGGGVNDLLEARLLEALRRESDGPVRHLPVRWRQGGNIELPRGSGELDLLVLTELERCDVTETRETHWASAEYCDGQVLVSNPAHEQAARVLAAAQQRLARARRSLADALLAAQPRPPHESRPLDRSRSKAPAKEPDLRDAAPAQLRSDPLVRRAVRAVAAASNAYDRAHASLAATPERVLADNIVTVRYPVHTVRATARVGLRVDILDAATGTLLARETLEGTSFAEDRAIDGDPRRNIPHDRLWLPDGATLCLRAAEGMNHRLTAVAATAAAHRGSGQLAIASAAARDASEGEALEQYLRYLLVAPQGSAGASQARRYIQGWLGQEASLVDLSTLLDQFAAGRPAGRP
jgi:tetratricopeptide (TPR) repeat protein